jgi:hypothetical protein
MASSGSRRHLVLRRERRLGLPHHRPEGHIVLDGGYPMASIAKLGFNIKDVKCS